ncbi:MAG: hypothetical protein WDN03_15565 [Rhizomicrobium sp.]
MIRTELDDEMRRFERPIALLAAGEQIVVAWFSVVLFGALFFLAILFSSHSWPAICACRLRF